MASTTMIETVTITRPLKPGEFARRMLGERPSPVPPTRELWPSPQQPLSISTLHVAYLQDEPSARRAATLPIQQYVQTAPSERRNETFTYRPTKCTVGTNTEPSPTIIARLRLMLKRQETSKNQLPPGRLTAVPRETNLDLNEEENCARRTLNRIRKAISGAKYRIAPGSEVVESPKIVYDMPKPGERMACVFGARESTRRYKLLSRVECSRRLRAIGGWCIRRRHRPPKRQPHPPPLQITQV